MKAEPLKEFAFVAGPNSAAIAFIKLADIKDWSAVAVAAITIAYTVWKWRKEAKKQ